MLCIQREDWQRFRVHQQRVRIRYQNGLFNTYVDDVRECRREYKFDGEVHLLLNSQQQNQQENWIEFQNYHIKQHKRLEKKRDRRTRDLIDAQKESYSKFTIDPEDAERALKQSLGYAERNLQRHEAMLEWIEQRRLEMVSRSPTSVEKESKNQKASPKVGRRASARQRQSKRLNTPAVLGKIRVSKSTSPSQSLRTQIIMASKSKPISLDSSVITPSSTQQVLKRRETKPRSAKKTPFSQRHSQRVTKAYQSADVGTKPWSDMQCSGARQTRDQETPQRRSALQRPHLVPGTVKTRSGRISRPPVRWTAY